LRRLLSGNGSAERVERLERRIEQLEAALEGLQDAVHRESTRQGEEIAELRHKTEPSKIARALSDDARRRGL
jgi:cell division protein FtsB